MSKLMLILITTVALALAACGPGADEPGNPQYPEDEPPGQTYP